MWARVAWAIVAASCVAYVVALQVGPSCAERVAPWAGGLFFVSFFGAALLHEWKGRR